MSLRPDYCPCYNEMPDPCPACGATLSGDDPVRGICQAKFGPEPTNYGLSLVLVPKQPNLKKEILCQ